MMKLSIIIVSWNVCKLLKALLRSIKGNIKDLEYEIIVIDDVSNDDTMSMLKNDFPEVTAIRNQNNIGFAASNNKGIAISKGEYILLLNPDVFVLPNAINDLVKFLDSHPEAGAGAGKMLNPNGTFQHGSRRSFPTVWNSLSYLLKLNRLFPQSPFFCSYDMGHLPIDCTHEIDCLTGAFLMVKRKVVKDVGALDEQFFLGGEDIDWCYRIKAEGWKIFYYPQSEIIHYGGQSSKQCSNKAIISFHKAMYLYYKKHFSGKNFFLINWLVYSGILLKAMFVLLINKLGLSVRSFS